MCPDVRKISNFHPDVKNLHFSARTLNCELKRAIIEPIMHKKAIKQKACIKRFFAFFRHSMHNYAFSCNKILNFTKMNESLLNRLYNSKFSTLGAHKMGQFSPIFKFFGALGAEKRVTLDQKCPPLFGLRSPSRVSPTTFRPPVHFPFFRQWGGLRQ